VRKDRLLATSLDSKEIEIDFANVAGLWATLSTLCASSIAKRAAIVVVLQGCHQMGDASELRGIEKDRFERLRLAIDRQNFVLGRTAIARLVRCQSVARSADFVYTPAGAPYLPGAPAFSLSHSREWFAIGVVGSGQIGVDIETFEGLSDVWPIIQQIAHPAEIRSFSAMSSKDRLQMAYRRCWTRKEAVLKALGTGWFVEGRGIDTRLEDSPVAQLDEPEQVRVVDLLNSVATANAAVAVSDPAVRVVDVVLLTGNAPEFAPSLLSCSVSLAQGSPLS